MWVKIRGCECEKWFAGVWLFVQTQTLPKYTDSLSSDANLLSLFVISIEKCTKYPGTVAAGTYRRFCRLVTGGISYQLSLINEFHELLDKRPKCTALLFVEFVCLYSTKDNLCGKKLHSPTPLCNHEWTECFCTSNNSNRLISLHVTSISGVAFSA